MKTSKLILLALLNSLGALAYIAAVVLLMNNAQGFLGQASNFLAGIAMLLLFVISATIVGSLVLGRPIYLYFSGFKKEGLAMLVCTTAFLLIITMTVFVVLILLK